MINVRLNHFSKVLSLENTVDILYPLEKDMSTDTPCLWLLHGYTGNNTSYTNLMSIQHSVSKIWPELCVIMPSVHNSYYTDMKNGGNYFTYLADELPCLIKDVFKISDCRQNTFAAGISMGGYGAFKLALSYPERFRATASISGIIDMLGYSLYAEYLPKRNVEIFYQAYGSIEEFSPENDTVYMAEKANKEKILPALYLCCGEDDFLYQNNLGYMEKLDSSNVKYKWESDSGYGHDVDYWYMKLPKILSYFKNLWESK